MVVSEKNSKVDTFLKDQVKWQEAFEALRTILLTCELKEEFLWSKPCYILRARISF